MGQLLALVEHVLLEDALVVAGHRDRADVVEAADVVRVRELDHVLRAVDVRALRCVLVGLDVVHRGEVEEVIDLAASKFSTPSPGFERSPSRHDASLRGAEPLGSASSFPREPSRTSA